MKWKKRRGKLGVFAPLMGRWLAEADSEMGAVTCRREFKKVLSGKYIQLTAHWEFASGTYDEVAMIGVNRDKKICFWSFTSDGKQSEGELADVGELHTEAIGFEAHMDSGLARMAYWPDEEEEGVYWVVESKTKKGWNRFVEHHYFKEEN